MPGVLDDWRNGRHVVYKLHAHIVLTPKYRRKVMTPRVTTLLGEVFIKVCARHDVIVEAFETDADHAHLLVSYPPKLALSRLVMSLKTISSMRVRAQGWPEITRALSGDHFWSPSYAVVSAGGAPLDIVKQYIENQQSPNRPKGRPARNQTSARTGLDPALTEGGCAVNLDQGQGGRPDSHSRGGLAT